MTDLGPLTKPPWVNIDPRDEATWPEDEQEVYYYFNATAPDDEGFNARRVFGGIFYAPEEDNEMSWGGYASWAGFCDWYDAPYWRPRHSSDDSDDIKLAKKRLTENENRDK